MCFAQADEYFRSLWGAATLQLYLYFNVCSSFSKRESNSLLNLLQNFSKKDSLWLKIFVLVVYAFDTAHQIMLVQFIYVYLVKEFGNFLFLIEVDR